MAPNPNLNPQQFFHGSATELLPGQRVLPASQSGAATNFAGHEGRRDYAFASASMAHAGMYANDARTLAEDRDPGRSHGSHVYQVQPTGRVEHDPEDTGMGNIAYMSRAPWKVTRKVPEHEWLSADDFPED